MYWNFTLNNICYKNIISVRDSLRVAHDLQLTTLMSLIHGAGLDDWVQNKQEYTWFAPSNAAFQGN